MSTHVHAEQQPSTDTVQEEELQPRQSEFLANSASADSKSDGTDWQAKLNQTERLGHTIGQVAVQPTSEPGASSPSGSFPLVVQPKVVVEEQKRDAKRETMMRGGIVQ